MADLSNLVPEVRKVNIGRGEVEVRGLDLTSIGLLIGKYGNEVNSLFKGENLDVTELLNSMPLMVDDIVAMAIDSTDQMELVARIPVDAKIAVLTEAWGLTIIDPKKFLEKLSSLAKSVQSVRTDPSPSASISQKE